MQYAYNKENIQFLDTSKYMMATTAIHKLGDISRGEVDLCTIVKQDEENYYGMWVTGAGFFDVQFPKATTRELTPAECEHYNGRSIQINNQPPVPLEVN